MQNLNSIVTNYDAATTDFPEGKFRDNPGDSTGSGVMAAMCNDLWYAAASIIKKYKTGGKSGAAETVISSDLLSALEALAKDQASSIPVWSASTTYSIDTQVTRFGINFISIYNASSNLNQDPITSPLFWNALPTAQEILYNYSHGVIVHGGSHPRHDYNNAAYQQYFPLGLHSMGGVDGISFNAYGVHLDGSAVGSGTLSTIIEAWFLKTAFAPGSTGSRVLKDARGKLLRAIDLATGQADEIGEVLQDQMQGHTIGTAALASIKTSASAGGGSMEVVRTEAGTALGIITDGTHNTPRTGLFTRDKSITVGVPYAVIVVPV
jgi:hypothetical protein